MTQGISSAASSPVSAAQLAEKTAQVVSLLRSAATDYAPAVFANSLGAEDMVLTDIIWTEDIDIEIFSLDTGRLPAETYDLMATAETHYGRKLAVYFPQADAVESFVLANGINGFYSSIDARKACCNARKVAPLQRALAGRKAWVTGLRASQAATRGELNVIDFDSANGLHKISPLSDWSEAEVWSYLRAKQVPYNQLHDKGFPSIGCAPCTRAVQPGEDIRAGRWWWETPETKECGLHMVDGRLQRIKATGIVE